MKNSTMHAINAVAAVPAAAGEITPRERMPTVLGLMVTIASLAAVGPLASSALAASTPEVTITCTGTNSCTATGSGFTPSGEVLAEAYAGSSNFTSTYLKASGPTYTCTTGGLKPVCVTLPGGSFATALPIDYWLACDATATGSVKYTDVSTGKAVSKPATWTGPCPGPTTTTLTFPSTVDTGWTPPVNPARVTAGSTLVTSGTITITVNGSLFCEYSAGATSGCTSAPLPAGTDRVEASYSGSAIPPYGPSSASDTVTVLPIFPSMPTTAPNWAGYVDTGDKFTAVSASWTVPKASCSFLEFSSSSTWVGIDGWNGNTVEQIGTDSNCIGTGDEYNAWWEMWPGGPTLIGVPFVSYVVHAGDLMTASVTSTGMPGWYTLQIEDTPANGDQGWTFSTTQFLAAATGATAECIEEEPTALSILGFQLGNSLTNFGSVTFNQCKTTGSDGIATPIWDHPNQAIEMTSGSTSKATVSPLSNDGTTFTVTYVPN
jgi:hypothetical protein